MRRKGGEGGGVGRERREKENWMDDTCKKLTLTIGDVLMYHLPSLRLVINPASQES
jgi:hypothetical protein